MIECCCLPLCTSRLRRHLSRVQQGARAGQKEAGLVASQKRGPHFAAVQARRARRLQSAGPLSFQVTGWGLTQSGDYADVLSEAVLPVVQNEKCQEAYEAAGVPLTVSEAMFCAGHANGTADACSGDSGGPMVFLDDAVTTERRWVLEGVVSWGSPSGCAVHNQYGGYTRVFAFLPWIRQFV